MRFLLLLGSFLASIGVSPVSANPYQGIRYEVSEGRVYEHLSGNLSIAASTASWSTYTITLEGESGVVHAETINVKHLTISTMTTTNVVATSGTFSGSLTAGTLIGDGSALTGLATDGELAAVAASTGALDLAKVNRAGDTMTGDLALPGLTATYGVSAATGVFTSTVSTPYLQGGGAAFTTAVTGISLSEIEDLEGDKVFTMANKTLEWQFTNPSGGMLWEFTGAAGGHSLEIRQSGGNPGADMRLLHLEASDTDPALLHLESPAVGTRALMLDVTGDSYMRYSILADGKTTWGSGAAVGDTNLYRSAADVLKTDDSLVVVGSITANTLYGDGSNLSGVVTSEVDPLSVPLAGGNMTGQLTTASTITVQGNAFSIGTSTFACVSGFCGVGTSSPEAKLHIAAGDILLDNTGWLYLKDTINTARPMIGMASGGDLNINWPGAFNTVINPNGGSVYVPTGNFIVGGSTLVVTGGKVGIGTGSPISPLTVTSATDELIVAQSKLATGNPSIALYQAGTQRTQLQYLDSGDIFRVYSDGDIQIGPGNSVLITAKQATSNVGIGTTAPATKLHVSSGVIYNDGTGAGIYTTGTSTAAAFCLNGDCQTEWSSSGLVDLGDGTATGNEPVVVWLTNGYDSAVSSGSIVIASTTANMFSLTTSASSSRALGVVYEPGGIAAGAVGRVAIGGVVRVNCADDTVIGTHVITSTTAGEASDTALPSSGTNIGMWLETCIASGDGAGNALLR